MRENYKPLGRGLRAVLTALTVFSYSSTVFSFFVRENRGPQELTYPRPYSDLIAVLGNQTGGLIF